MKTVILAGGYGTRLSEESHLRPKPMVEIGNMPILWHILKSYSYYGYNDFIICCGYKGYVIKEYFSDYFLHCSDVTFDFTSNNKMIIHNNVAEPWRVTLVDTGLDTRTGGRVKRIRKYVGDEAFMLTYGDGLSDINLNSLRSFHDIHGKIATITAVQPGGKFGVLDIEQEYKVTKFSEKAKEDGGWINGGFMILSPKIFDFIKDDDVVLERYPLEECARRGELVAYKYYGFWQCMDTMRDKTYLDQLLMDGRAPWKRW